MSEIEVEAVIEKDTKTVQDVKEPEKYQVIFVNDNFTPNYNDVVHVPIDNTTSYSFNKTINPNSEITIRFNARAINSGTYNSTIDFCINSEISFLSRGIFTEIKVY